MTQDQETKLANRYSLIRRIGAGGMAAVYLAKDEVLNREVAVKRLHADSPEDAVRRFRREAQLAAGLSHPNLVTVFDAFSEGDDLIVVMEYIPGSDLSKLIRDRPPRREEGIRILSDVAAAIDHIHNAGIVHRDIKPANVLLSADGGVAKLTDLGIAKIVEETSTTQIDAIPGSVPYMAPEQLNGDVVGPRADIYAFSLVAYEVLSGARARQGTAAQISYQLTHEPPPDLRDVVPRTPPRAADVLRDALAQRPDDRPENAREIVEELTQAFQARRPHSTVGVATPDPGPHEQGALVRRDRPTGSIPPPEKPHPRQSRTGRWIILPLVALALAVTTVLLATGVGRDDPDSGAGVPARPGDGTTADGGGSGRSTGAETSPPGGSPSPAPAASVQGFYEAAASGDFAAASELASPDLLTQLGGEEGVAGTFNTLESIAFEDLRIENQSGAEALVSFSTTAEHTDRTEACSGTASVELVDGAWLVDQIEGVSCQPSG